LKTEYYIKTGLVVLGATILFDEIVGAGMLGIMQALIVVLSVWAFAFWLARRLHVDDEMATMLASAVSICGVSAGHRDCGAIQGDKKKAVLRDVARPARRHADDGLDAARSEGDGHVVRRCRRVAWRHARHECGGRGGG
jgi:hypothetical protein